MEPEQVVNIAGALPDFEELIANELSKMESKAIGCLVHARDLPRAREWEISQRTIAQTRETFEKKRRKENGTD